MAKLVLGILIAAAFVTPLSVGARQNSSNQETSAARSKNGKKLFGTAEALRVARVSSPRISPDGSRVAYLVAENDTEQEQEWKSVTHLWVVPAAGPADAARQFTRGEKSVSNVEWSPDGKLLAFTMDAGEEKDAKPQVWFMYADGGEPWQVTKHKSGVRGFQISPDGKTLLLMATAPVSEEEEKRGKQKDDAVVA
ncbi:MAG: TolB family protein, partial [Candidatus Acidiferrales bacterium]